MKGKISVGVQYKCNFLQDILSPQLFELVNLEGYLHLLPSPL